MAIQTLVSPLVFSPIQSTPTSSKFRDYATFPIQPEGLEALTEHRQVDSSCLPAVRQSFSKFLRGYPKSYSPHGAQEQNLSINPVGEGGMAGVWNGKSIQFLVI